VWLLLTVKISSLLAAMGIEFASNKGQNESFLAPSIEKITFLF
jgi:hypothetical protein